MSDPRTGHVGEAALMQRRRRRTRVTVAIASVLLAGGIGAAALWGDDWACHHAISRENVSVPDLTGLTVAEAERSLPTCVAVEPGGSVPADEPQARIVEQHPAPASLLDSLREVEVVLEPPSPPSP